MSTPGARKIIEEIEKTAATRSSTLLDEAKAKVDASLKQAQEKAAEEEKALLNRGEQEARRESQRILAEARIKARREKVQAQEEIVRRCFERAGEQLRTLAEKRSLQGIQYRDVLGRLLQESLTAAGAQSLEVFANPRDHEILKEVLAGATEAGRQQVDLKLSPDGISCSGGLAVRSSDGKISVDNTFESRLQRFRETLRTEVATKLFAGESPDGQ